MKATVPAVICAILGIASDITMLWVDNWLDFSQVCVNAVVFSLCFLTFCNYRRIR